MCVCVCVCVCVCTVRVCAPPTPDLLVLLLQPTDLTGERHSQFLHFPPQLTDQLSLLLTLSAVLRLRLLQSQGQPLSRALGILEQLVVTTGQSIVFREQLLVVCQGGRQLGPGQGVDSGRGKC